MNVLPPTIGHIQLPVAIEPSVATSEFSGIKMGNIPLAPDLLWHPIYGLAPDKVTLWRVQTRSS